MATLGSVYHDFSRLAKQSGFYFQLHTGRVNWLEIENVDLDEIIEKRNFQLLEENLINVINCNLEREYDLKILDPNFVKLFKLAQLGVDYLSYCEMYLDKCVVLLQEQLNAFQEEYEELKRENERKKEELNKSKRKNKIPNYQCEKCEKVFISDVYLKFHDKRRHSTPSTPNTLEKSQKKCTDNWQQTDDSLLRKLSTSTQTLHLDEQSTETLGNENNNSIKMEYSVKIEKLEHELNDLKKYLKKVETSHPEQIEASQSNVFHPSYPQEPVYFNPMLMLLPSYLKQSDHVHYKVNPEYQTSIPVSEFSNINNPVIASTGNSVTVESIPQPQTSSQLNSVVERGETSLVTTESTKGFQELQITTKDYLDCEKENIDPRIKKSNPPNLTKPLPPPRKSKRKALIQPPVNKMSVQAFTVVNNTNPEIEPEGFVSHSITHRSTPINPEEKTDSEIHNDSKENLSEINKSEINSTESLPSRNSADSKSVIKRIVGRNSPKLRRFSESLKRSLTNLYDSVSSTEKVSRKRELNENNSREAVLLKVENYLRELGIDPEWQGVSKKTMKQKLNILKYRRKLLSKENPVFPIIRQNIEEKIIQKLKNNFGKKSLNNNLNNSSTNVEDPVDEDFSRVDKPEFAKVKNCTMYDIEPDSEFQISDSEKNFDETPHRKTSEKSVTVEEVNSSSEPEEKFNGEKSKKFDFSIFQVSNGTPNSLAEDTQVKQFSLINNEGLHSDSDSDDSFLERLDGKLLQTCKSKKIENTESSKNYDNSQTKFSFSGTLDQQNQNSILKDEGLQSRLTSSGRKKVFFAKSDGIEELSDIPTDDDFWPFKSEGKRI